MSTHLRRRLRWLMTHAELPEGHGFLVPRSEEPQDHGLHLCPQEISVPRSRGTQKLLRCFFSSSRMPDLLTHSDEDLQQLARQELKDILGMTAEPVLRARFRWDRAMAQYETGHLERVAEMEKIIARCRDFISSATHFMGSACRTASSQRGWRWSRSLPAFHSPRWFSLLTSLPCAVSPCAACSRLLCRQRGLRFLRQLFQNHADRTPELAL